MKIYILYKSLRKWTFLALSFIFILAVNAGTYSGGDGTMGTPYLISTTDDLIELSLTSGDWDKYFEQTADLVFDADESLVDWDGNGSADGPLTDGFKPIALGNGAFRGTYDGGDYTIENLFIKKSGVHNIGLFSYIYGGTVKNLTLLSPEVTGARRVGALVGLIEKGTIDNVDVKSIPVVGENETGGLVGRADNKFVNMYQESSTDPVGTTVPSVETEPCGDENCDGCSDDECEECDNAECDGDGTSDFGKIEISNVNVGGSITGVDRVGGLIGYAKAHDLGYHSPDMYEVTVVEDTEPTMPEHNLIISNSKTKVMVAGCFEVGGFAGRTQHGKVMDSKACAMVTGLHEHKIGGFVGHFHHSKYINVCYYEPTGLHAIGINHWNEVIPMCACHYTVTYEAPGADVTGDVPAPQDYSDGETVTVEGQGNLARVGYTFTGWEDLDPTAPVAITAGTFVMPERNVVLTAQWNAIPDTNSFFVQTDQNVVLQFSASTRGAAYTYTDPEGEPQAHLLMITVPEKGIIFVDEGVPGERDPSDLIVYDNTQIHPDDVQLLAYEPEQDDVSTQTGTFAVSDGYSYSPTRTYEIEIVEVTPVLDLTLEVNGDVLTIIAGEEIDVKEYQIYDLQSGELLGIILAGDGSYTFKLPAKSLDVYVLIVDHSGYTQRVSPEDNNVVVVAHELEEGWNLLSIHGDNADLSELEKVMVGNMWTWEDGQYVAKAAPEVTQGFWVYSAVATTIQIKADRADDEINLVTGWNLVGPTDNSYMPAGVISAHTWNDSHQDLLEAGILLNGVGYWLFSF